MSNKNKLVEVYIAVRISILICFFNTIILGNSVDSSAVDTTEYRILKGLFLDGRTSPKEEQKPIIYVKNDSLTSENSTTKRNENRQNKRGQSSCGDDIIFGLKVTGVLLLVLIAAIIIDGGQLGPLH